MNYNKGIKVNNQNALNYFRNLLNNGMTNAQKNSVEVWDRRADNWEKDYQDSEKKKNNERIIATVDYLRKKRLLEPNYDVIDVGCGPGRFVAEFARTAHHVTGIDFSPKMIQYGIEHLKREQIENASLYVRDFQTLDIEEEKLAGKFELVFSSNTPAVQNTSGLEKLMKMSRKYCCYVTHIHSENELESRIMGEVFGRERPPFWSGPSFYSVFNILFLQGYYPEVTYYKQNREFYIKPNSRRIELFMEQMLEPSERTEKNAGRIEKWLKDHANSDGLVKEASVVWSGRLLWNINEKSVRTAYDRQR
ncbi:MAG: class I SAM-dependent methyltransferase [Anaerovoracaceae bacterium]|jgi:SAM-dependent methyltransferase